MFGFRQRDAPKELAIRECKPIALQWIDAALAALRDDPGSDLVRAGLAINFSAGTSGDVNIAQIIATYMQSREVIERSGRYFMGVSERRAKRVFRSENIPPAYAIFKNGMYFTPLFAAHNPETGRGFGPMCRTAMLVHESVHVIDALSGLPAIHISEWDEPKFSAQTAEESLHNPSSYASFSAQMFERVLEWPRNARYGAGRPAD
jgi:hypothetical protein